MLPKEKSLPGKVVTGTSRATMGGGAILIGLALFLLFRGFGPGGTGSSGSGTGADPSPGSAEKLVVSKETEPEAEEEHTNDLVAPDSTDGGLSNDEKKALSGEILTVLIDERSFLMELPDSSGSVFRPASLDRILELASMAKGDTNGTKVRILLRENARASAQAELKFGLERKGIGAGSIIMPDEFVP